MSIILIGSVCQAVSFTGKLPVMQGYTDESLTMITAMKKSGQKFTYEVSPARSTSLLIKSNDVGHSHAVDTIEITGLEVDQSYELIIKNDNGEVVDSRQFQSINSRLENPKAAVCSCSRIGMLSPDDKSRSMWDRLMDEKPDAILFLGDIVYGDNAVQAVLKFLFNYHPKFLQIQKRFIESWQQERLYRQPKLIPLFSIWDDHDFGFEASDKKNPFKDKMLKLFRSYYPVPEKYTSVEHGPGASYSFRLFDRKVIMLDNRSFLSVKGHSLLGLKQIKWMEEQIKNERDVIISSGMSIIDTGGLHHSIQRNSPVEWHRIKNIFVKYPVKAVFLTGDVHFSEVRDVPQHILGFKTFQVVSSRFKSTSPRITPPFKSGLQPKKPYDTNKPKPPEQLLHVGGSNFAILSLANLFETLDVTYYKSKNQKPIRLVESFETSSCLKYYSNY